MQILIVGVNHQIQPTEILSWSSDGKAQDFERDQKERFGAFVAAQIHERDVELIVEEARHGHETITKRVCDNEKCRYSNVISDTPLPLACCSRAGGQAGAGTHECR